MRYLIAALLSVALILAAPAKQSNSDLKKMASAQSAAVNAGQAWKPATEEVADLEEKAPEPQAGLSEEHVAPTCASEVKKYDWPHSIALQIVEAESGHNPSKLNDNPATGDYSVGCFQVNLRGQANLRAKYRDAVKAGYTGSMTVSGLEQWLKDPVNNVAVAYIMWKAQSWSPWGHTTCKYKVKCY